MRDSSEDRTRPEKPEHPTPEASLPGRVRGDPRESQQDNQTEPAEDGVRASRCQLSWRPRKTQSLQPYFLMAGFT